MRPDAIRRPELLLSDLVQRELTPGVQDGILSRVSVLAVDLEGGRLQNPSGEGTFESLFPDGKKRSFQALAGPANPRGSIKGRVLSQGSDRLLHDDETRIFWPLFSADQFSLPISPGEHAYVLWEGTGTEHGIWICRVSGQDSANVFVGSDSYTASPVAQQSAMDLFEAKPQDYDRDDSRAARSPSSSNLDMMFKDPDVP